MDPTPDPLHAVRAAANLARIDLDEGQEAALARDLGSILTAFSALEQVPVEGLEPLYAPHPPADATRDDEPRPSLARDLLLDQAPESEDGHYRVPRAIE